MKQIAPILAALLLSSCLARAPTPRVACAGPQGAEESLLVYGDSWSAKQPMVDELAKSGRRVCAVGYPGAKSAKLARWLDVASAERTLGQRPDKVLVIAGINDAVGHSGSGDYVASVQSILGEWRGQGAQTFLLELPAFRTGDKEKSLPVRAVQQARRLVLDRGQEDVVAKYRSAASSAGIATIDFDGFIRSYEASPSSYLDGRHLSDAEYARLGRYLAPHL